MTKEIKVTVESGLSITEEEKAYYISQMQAKHPDETISEIIVSIDENDDEYANVQAVCEGRPFERIRRITGYLVGTLDRFNDAKRSEEKARVKHAAE